MGVVPEATPGCDTSELALGQRRSLPGVVPAERVRIVFAGNETGYA